MSDFEQAIEAAESRNHPEPNMGGSFECQYCGARVKGAHYDPKKELLRWWCDCGKESRIQEFKI